jgi:hypothetical protein
MAFEEAALLLGSGSLLTRGAVVSCLDTGEILVRTEAEPPAQVLCDFLVTSSAPPPELRPGDRVLLLLPPSEDEKGCVLGRIGAYRKPEPAVPQQIVLEAQKEVTLKCGEGVVTLREDGKVLIKGQDVVSHARRRQRIKGGSVAIN